MASSSVAVQPVTLFRAAQTTLTPSMVKGRTARPKNQWMGLFQQKPPIGHLTGHEFLLSIFFSLFLEDFLELDIQTKPDHEVEIVGVILREWDVTREVKRSIAAHGPV